MELKALGKILHNGKNYKPGDTVVGLTEEEHARLIGLNVGEEIDQDAATDLTGADGNNELAGLQLNAPTIISVKEFTQLKADEQKAHLKALKIEPAGKEEERVAQYDEWYADQVTGADND